MKKYAIGLCTFEEDIEVVIIEAENGLMAMRNAVVGKYQWDVIDEDEELLKHIKENNIIDLSSIQQEIEMKKNAEYLKMHPYKIWKCSSDGRWYTRIEGGKKKKSVRL